MAYILVHQTGLADTAVAQDDNLSLGTIVSSCCLEDTILQLTLTLRRTFFLEDMTGGMELDNVPFDKV